MAWSLLGFSLPSKEGRATDSRRFRKATVQVSQQGNCIPGWKPLHGLFKGLPKNFTVWHGFLVASVHMLVTAKHIYIAWGHEYSCMDQASRNYGMPAQITCSAEFARDQDENARTSACFISAVYVMPGLVTPLTLK
jgi:hypothetical protein